MTDEYQTGRIYSGIFRDGERELFLCEKDIFKGVGKALWTGSLTDVRGPLVMLDLGGVDVEYAVKMMRDCGCDTNVIADQIEEQTRPPLQIGWHEVEAHSVKGIRRWDGRMWSYSTGPLDDFQGWASTHYIGPGGSDD